jgi:hypothetical protein
LRRRNSDRRLDRIVREDPPEDEPRGILEIFERDEDAPLARDADEEVVEERRPGP